MFRSHSAQINLFAYGLITSYAARTLSVPAALTPRHWDAECRSNRSKCAAVIGGPWPAPDRVNGQNAAGACHINGVPAIWRLSESPGFMAGQTFQQRKLECRTTVGGFHDCFVTLFYYLFYIDYIFSAISSIY